MIADAIKQISQMAKESISSVRYLQNPLDDDEVIFVNGDEITKVRRPPERRVFPLGSVDQAPLFFGQFCNDQTSSVWYSTSRVEVVIDHSPGSLLDIGRVTLEETEEFAALSKYCENDSQLSPKQLIRLLRTTFAECLDQDYLNKLVHQLRHATFVSGRSQEVHVGRGRESLGTEITGAIGGTLAEIPEVVEFAIRCIDDPVLVRRSPVKVQLEINVDSASLSIVPSKVDLTAAGNDAADLLGKYLQANMKCPVFFTGGRSIYPGQ